MSDKELAALRQRVDELEQLVVALVDVALVDQRQPGLDELPTLELQHLRFVERIRRDHPDW